MKESNISAKSRIPAIRQQHIAKAFLNVPLTWVWRLCLRGRIRDDSTKQQISVAICGLSAADQRFQGCQEIVEIKFCKNSSVPELDAAFKLVLVAPRIESSRK